MARLPVDKRGYPVPRFVQWIDGEHDFRVMNPEFWRRCVREHVCWVCGEKLGAYLAFVIGPMCGVNRTTSEPPCHLECARWSAKNCPFLSRPHMTRRDSDGLQERGSSVGGIALLRNPGVTLVWITRSYRVHPDGAGGWLIEVGEPLETEWWCEGRAATRAEVQESIRTGLPRLEVLAKHEAGGMNALQDEVNRLERLLPAPDG